ncbi:hypothetical protein DIPPA_05548 [Diplonema papillatum]|nr:hypothetical protein DIPPA_05548 [Diplonema papillatum]
MGIRTPEIVDRPKQSESPDGVERTELAYGEAAMEPAASWMASQVEGKYGLYDVKRRPPGAVALEPLQRERPRAAKGPAAGPSVQVPWSKWVSYLSLCGWPELSWHTGEAAMEPVASWMASQVESKYGLYDVKRRPPGAVALEPLQRERPRAAKGPAAGPSVQVPWSKWVVPVAVRLEGLRRRRRRRATARASERRKLSTAQSNARKELSWHTGEAAMEPVASWMASQVEGKYGLYDVKRRPPGAVALEPLQRERPRAAKGPAAGPSVQVPWSKRVVPVAARLEGLRRRRRRRAAARASERRKLSTAQSKAPAARERTELAYGEAAMEPVASWMASQVEGKYGLYDVKRRPPGAVALEPLQRERPRAAKGPAAGPSVQVPWSKRVSYLSLRGWKDFAGDGVGALPPGFLAKAPGLDPATFLPPAARARAGGDRRRSPARRRLAPLPAGGAAGPGSSRASDLSEARGAVDSFHGWYILEKRSLKAQVEDDVLQYAVRVEESEAAGRAAIAEECAEYAAFRRLSPPAPAAAARPAVRRALRFLKKNLRDPTVAAASLAAVRGWAATPWGAALFVEAGGLEYLSGVLAAGAGEGLVVKSVAGSVALVASVAHTQSAFAQSGLSLQLLRSLHAFQHDVEVATAVVSCLRVVVANTPSQASIAPICTSPFGLPLVLTLSSRFQSSSAFLTEAALFVKGIAPQPLAERALVSEQGMKHLLAVCAAARGASWFVRAAALRAAVGLMENKKGSRISLAEQNVGVFFLRIVDDALHALGGEPCRRRAAAIERVVSVGVEAIFKLASASCTVGCRALAPAAAAVLARAAGVSGLVPACLARLSFAPPVKPPHTGAVGVPPLASALYRPPSDFRLLSTLHRVSPAQPEGADDDADSDEYQSSEASTEQDPGPPEIWYTGTHQRAAVLVKCRFLPLLAAEDAGCDQAPRDSARLQARLRAFTAEVSEQARTWSPLLLNLTAWSVQKCVPYHVPDPFSDAPLPEAQTPSFVLYSVYDTGDPGATSLEDYLAEQLVRATSLLAGADEQAQPLPECIETARPHSREEDLMLASNKRERQERQERQAAPEHEAKIPPPAETGCFGEAESPSASFESNDRSDTPSGTPSSTSGAPVTAGDVLRMARGDAAAFPGLQLCCAVDADLAAAAAAAAAAGRSGPGGGSSSSGGSSGGSELLRYRHFFEVAAGVAGGLAHLENAGGVAVGDVGSRTVWRTRGGQWRLQWGGAKPGRRPPGRSDLPAGGRGSQSADGGPCADGLRGLGGALADVLFYTSSFAKAMLHSCGAASSKLPPLLLNAIVAPCFGSASFTDVGMLGVGTDGLQPPSVDISTFTRILHDVSTLCTLRASYQTEDGPPLDEADTCDELYDVDRSLVSFVDWVVSRRDCVFRFLPAGDRFGFLAALSSWDVREVDSIPSPSDLIPFL